MTLLNVLKMDYLHPWYLPPTWWLIQPSVPNWNGFINLIDFSDPSEWDCASWFWWQKSDSSEHQTISERAHGTATIWSFVLLMNDDNVSDDDGTLVKVTTMMTMMRVVAMMKMNLLMGKTGRVMEWLVGLVASTFSLAPTTDRGCFSRPTISLHAYVTCLHGKRRYIFVTSYMHLMQRRNWELKLCIS